MTLNNIDIHRRVLEELAWDPRVREREIAVAVKEGVVTLSGKVTSNAEKQAAARAAERVPAVRAVANDIDVRIADPHAPSDTDLAHAVVDRLKWDTEVPDERLQTRVDNRWIILEGTVEWSFQREAAERAVRNLFGVRGVSNLIAIEPKIESSEVKHRIESALRRYADEEARRINVEISGNRVILRGTVRTWAELQQVLTAAWDSGAMYVDNHLLIGEPALT